MSSSRSFELTYHRSLSSPFHLSALIRNWADVTFPFQKENPSSLEKHLPSTKNINKVTHVNTLLTTYTSLYVPPVRFRALCPQKKQPHPPQASRFACIAEPQSVGFCGDTLDLTTQPFLFPKKYLGSWGYIFRYGWWQPDIRDQLTSWYGE